MPLWLKATAGIGSTLLVILGLVIALLKGVLALVGVISFAIKALVVLAFIAVFLGVAVFVFRSWSDKRKHKA